jgi:hypothetical protein
VPVPGAADALDLFRRAIVAGDQAAWGALCAHYGGLVCAWLRRHPAWHLAGEEADYLANRAFERFWRSVGPDRFGTFAGLPALLQYLKLCAHSALLDEARARARQPAGHACPPATVPGFEEGVLGRISAGELWQAVRAEVRDETELLVATLSFVHALTPREICARHPEQVADVGEVYRIKRNLLDRLRRDETIRRAHTWGIRTSEPGSPAISLQVADSPVLAGITDCPQSTDAIAGGTS